MTLEAITPPMLPEWASKALKSQRGEIVQLIAAADQSRKDFSERFESLSEGDVMNVNFLNAGERMAARVTQLRDEVTAREAMEAYYEALQSESEAESTRRSNLVEASRHEACQKLTAAGFADYDPAKRSCLMDHVVQNYSGFLAAYASVQSVERDQSKLLSESGANGRALEAVRTRLETIRQNALREAALV